MSFGFSVGDILAGAELAYTLCQALSDSKGASKEYQELCNELLVVHKVLLQVDQLRAANQLAQATINALLFTINATNDVIVDFLAHYETYQDSLKQGGSGNPFKDVYKKGRWAVQMPDKVRGLQTALATMLTAINCLVSMACYYNTDYDPRCSATIKPNYYAASDLDTWDKGPRKRVRIASNMFAFDPVNCPDFNKQAAPESFFRPGQIFAVQVTSNLYLNNRRGFRNVDFGALPLGPIPDLKAKAAEEKLEDRAKRLDQLRNLPLKQMTLYCKSLPQNPDRVTCLLCNTQNTGSNAATPSYTKDFWASNHFRFVHWQYYFSMLPSEASNRLVKKRRAKLVPPTKLAQPNPESDFSAEDWINLNQVTQDVPIITETDIIKDMNDASELDHYLKGPVLVRRFVVVRQGLDECLCLGIHTFARHGCGDQPDQELFGILHSSEEPPAPMPDETGMVLLPVRMKSEHPSTALPRTARIHYGRVYEIAHYLPVQPIGLVHDASMETLLDQYEEATTAQNNEVEEIPVKKALPLIPDDMLLQEDMDEIDDILSNDREPCEPGVKPADWTIAKSIREDITSVLGSDISPAVF